ncbi:MAG: transcriptional repressor LexA [Deltaproteobacteria bacterium]|nr:MAG: transcriptional repressor LexA [Deltaproteobacteria bacterium]
MSKSNLTFEIPNTPQEELPKLTPRQQKVLDCIVQAINDNGYPPTLREIGRKLGIKSTNGVSDHIKALQRKGYLKKGDLRARALTPLVPDVDESGPTQMIPLVGKVAAGAPIPRVEWEDEGIHIDRSLLGANSNPEVFALKVVGESMIEDGILEDDILFVRRQPHAKNGDTVVAVVDDEVTVKRFYKEAKGIRLQPANSTMDPIYLSATEWQSVEVLGVSVGLYRKI